MKHLSLCGLLAIALLAGCSTSSDTLVPDDQPGDLYAEAQKSLQQGLWTQATEKLEALDSRYPFGAYSEQVQMDLIYAYYKSDNFPLAEATISRFNRLHPSHPKADWVLYMKGLTAMAQDRSFMHDLFRVDRSDRDPEPARRAFADFQRLLERYPDSNYAADAQARMVFLKNRLANYELATVDFYIRRGAWVAALNRAQQLQQYYPDTEAARKVLPFMLTAYNELGLEEPAEFTRQMMAINP
uniref:outer membrane protein assembly factor BamD n=1 Tax=Thaumasiovibrio occultus TaxID=1891184 RepID=UPI000B35CA82|nr:outer membrane protein assembly factor BamD [Thaumasiovibrio occultus]